jgi:hypothetical protein
MQNMLKHVGDGGMCLIRFNGFPLAALEFIRGNRNPPSPFILNPAAGREGHGIGMPTHEWDADAHGFEEKLIRVLEIL